MKIYLISTPEYEPEHLVEVYQLLQSIQGPMQFISDPYKFNEDEFPFLQKYWQSFRFPATNSDTKKINFDPDRSIPLSWVELYSLCNSYRHTFNIQETDFVVLLTNRKNALNFFSNVDKNRNIFIHAGDWEYYIKAPHKFPLAYHVVSNILLYHMDLNHYVEDSPNIHLEPIGCMNDFCQHKRQIILKLRTGDICGDCLSRLRDHGVGDEIINQAIGLFEVIRTQLLFRQGFTKNITPKKVTIDAKGKVSIGDLSIKLKPLEATLFIFYLIYIDGVALNDLEDHREEMLSIYRVIRRNGEEATIKELTKPYHEQGTFSVNKTRLNTTLKKALGEPLSNYYTLEGGRGGAFKINLPADLISIDEKLRERLLHSK